MSLSCSRRFRFEDSDGAPGMLGEMSSSLDALLRRLRLDRALAAHDPALIGARALQLQDAGAVVILCRSGAGFAARLRSVYGDHVGFTALAAEEIEGCTFTLMGTAVQIIGRPQPVRRQRDFRLFQLQVRLLRLLGAPLREAVQAGMARGRAVESAFADAMGVSELLLLERVPPVGLRERWSAAQRPAPPVRPAPMAAPEPEPEEETPDGDDLLRQPDPLLKERRVTWLDPARLLPVSRQDLPSPRRAESPSQKPRLPKKP